LRGEEAKQPDKRLKINTIEGQKRVKSQVNVAKRLPVHEVLMGA